jgi:competence protein ComEC
MKFKIFILISILVLGAVAWATWPTDKLKIIFCDVGQGDGALVMQNSFQMVIDTGPENKKMLNCLENHMPFWDKKIEALIISHYDLDHIGGLKEMEKYYQVEQKFSSVNLVKNDVVSNGRIEFEVLSPDQDWGDDNKNSLVGILRYKDKNILFTGDADSEVEQKMVWRNELMTMDILKVSHHGSNTGTSEELLNELRPKEAIISVGKNNSFGHPTREVLERLEKYGSVIWRTDLQGERVIEW